MWIGFSGIHRASGAVIPLVVFVPMAPIRIGLNEDDAVGGGLGAEMQGPPEGVRVASSPADALHTGCGCGWWVAPRRKSHGLGERQHVIILSPRRAVAANPTCHSRLSADASQNLFPTPHWR